MIAGELPPPDPDLLAARQAYEQARYREVLPAVERALSHPLPDAERVQAHALAAMTYAAFDDANAAVRSYREALKVDPRFEPPMSVSPKVRALFEEARRTMPVVVQLPPAPPPAPGVPVWQRPWVWVVGGVVLGGAAAGVVYATGQRVPAGTLGRGVMQ